MLKLNQSTLLSNRILRVAAILAAILLSAGMGAIASPELVVGAMVVAGAAPLLILLTRWPEGGLVAFIPIALLAPFQLGTNSSVALNAPYLLVPLLTGIWILRMVLVDKEVRLQSSRVNLPALLFVLATSLALLTGQVRWIPAAENASLTSQLGGWGLYVFSAVLFLLAANQIRM